ncbi:hypothetical protein M409DRAFT_22014 [Zasmidium cellare ATCC 36951]|uniref:F-box domain-containing protein n=1 Tax=Zasmidium cellare ATCC 36951 TaxID=1080233 RepID=A0A6A6CQW5_ZASCE|nr:uncharacterized protein M409DRAFT_22014 [Zasmidium cellare ATCC 36951]KAF2167866.1 hypothetical protein M409DRAFT_22014 [Zasmidium cellare ATCC 36951]
MFTRRRPSTAPVEDGEEVLPYRPVKAKFVQLHVTSDDINVSPPTRRQRIDDFRKPAIPERTTSLHRKTDTWPASIREQRRAGGYNFDGTPTLVRTPWEWERGRPNSQWSRGSDRLSNLPKKIFAQLPREIYQCIVEHVEGVHTVGQTVDVPALRHDLRSLCLVDKRWHRVARDHLYRELWLPSNKAPTKRTFSRQQKPSRLRLLLNTLRTAPGLAFLVHSIRVTFELANELEADVQSTFKKASTLDVLQEIINGCYNLEQFSGYVLPATTTTRDVFDALSTRTRMKSHVWKLDSNHELPSLLDFIHCHANWMRLETLVLSADPGVDLGQVAVSAVLHRLPALKHLMLSGLHQSDVNNTTILTLPALKSLRFSNLAGLTDQGIEQLAYSRLASSLEKLSLVGLELGSLQTVQTVLAHLTRLKSFALVQDASPESSTGVRPSSRPGQLSSPSLRYLHWDCLLPGSAITHLADAISTNKFPHLRKIKIPCDYDGAIQALCRPIPREQLTKADIQYLSEHTTHKYERDLRVSQIQAQLRVRESRQQPSFNVVVQDESMEICSTHVIGSYLGDMASKIEYCLAADAGDRALIELEDVARRKGNWRLETKVDTGILF